MMRALSLGLLLSMSAAACSDDDPGTQPDAPPSDGPADGPGCDPLTVLPSSFRPIAKISTGTLTAVAGGRTDVDATAGGITMSADNPYIYLNLKTGTKVDVNDIEARNSMAWDVAFKRASVRVNGGDSGVGGRTLSPVAAATLAEVTAVPSSGFVADDFADASCMLVALPAGEPSSAFGLWYNYDETAHTLTAKPEVYVIKRPDGSHTALRIETYYRDPVAKMGGGLYEIEWKQL